MHITKANASVIMLAITKLLLYCKLLFLLLFHNHEDTTADHNGVLRNPEGTGRVHLDTGLRLDTQVTLLHHHQSSGDSDAPKKMH